MKTNWKTTLAGLLAFGIQVAGIWAPGVLGSAKVQQTIQMGTIAAGLLAARDAKNKAVPDQLSLPLSAKAAGTGR